MKWVKCIPKEEISASAPVEISNALSPSDAVGTSPEVIRQTYCLDKTATEAGWERTVAFRGARRGGRGAGEGQDSGSHGGECRGAGHEARGGGDAGVGRDGVGAVAVTPAVVVAVVTLALAVVVPIVHAVAVAVAAVLAQTLALTVAISIAVDRTLAVGALLVAVAGDIGGTTALAESVLFNEDGS